MHFVKFLKGDKENGVSNGDVPSSSPVKRVSKGQVSLTDSQYASLFASVSRRVLEGNFLDLDERFAGSQDALEGMNSISPFVYSFYE